MSKSRLKSYKKRKSRTKRRLTKKRLIKRIKNTQRGGLMTISADTNPIAYKEDEYDQLKNILNYDPSKQ